MLKVSAVSLVAFVLAISQGGEGRTQGKDRSATTPPDPAVGETEITHAESAVDPPATLPPARSALVTSPSAVVVRGDFVSVQVNVDALGRNIVGDAANEPSIAIDPTLQSRISIGWRQFDTISSNFRQSGNAYSHDAGQTWTFPGVLEPNVFSSDPVLDFDADGRFYYYALQPDRGPGDWACYMYKSFDGGATWPQEFYAFGGDKAWMAIDRTAGVGRGNIYVSWSTAAGCCGESTFNRSTNGGTIFSYPMPVPSKPRWGTLTVAPDGALYIAGVGAGGFVVVRSSNAQNPLATPTFDLVSTVNLGGTMVFGGGPNPGGLLGQVWIASDHSDGPNRGNLYALCSVDPPGSDPLDVMFTRSTDRGENWSDPIRLNDDPTNTLAWQWFGTMSVAPNGRIDVVFNDTRSDASDLYSELYYTSSGDAGVTWSDNTPLSPAFEHGLGYPSQNKLGDYYDMISDNFGVGVAYAATFNGEQDVYYLRIGELDCNGNGTSDVEDIANNSSDDCNGNDVPDECEGDCNGTGQPDVCDIADNVSDDCDGNRVPDECDPDFDGDGLIDECDDDRDGDGVNDSTDRCDYTPLDMQVTQRGVAIGDQNEDCIVDLADYPRYFICFDLAGPDVQLGLFCRSTFDFDGDLDVDLADHARFMTAFGRE